MLKEDKCKMEEANILGIRAIERKGLETYKKLRIGEARVNLEQETREKK